MKKTLLVAVAIVFAGCRSDGLLSPNVLTYAATSRIAPIPFDKDAAPGVETTIFIKNHTDNTIAFTYGHGDCGDLELNVFSSPKITGTPVWKSPPPGVCGGVAYGPGPLAPGDSIQVVIYERVSSILGADLPSGTYYFQVVQQIGGGDIRESPVAIPAGSATLTR